MEEFELHGARAARLAAGIGTQLGSLRPAEIRALERAAFTHDIGHRFLVSAPATKRGPIYVDALVKFASGLPADVPDSEWIDPLVPARWRKRPPASDPSHYSFG